MPTRTTPRKKPNILFIAIDSLLSTHMSCYGYDRQTTPHMDKFAEGGTLFENTFSPNVPTTPGYACMLSGKDVFSTQCVALRHQGPLAKGIKTLPELLRKEGYNTTCVGGSKGNVAWRGFDTYLDYKAWGDSSDGALNKAHALNEVTVPEMDRLAKSKKPFLLFLRHMDPHSPYLPPAPYDRMFYHGNPCDPKNKSMKPVFDFKPFADYFVTWMPQGITDKDYVIAQYDGAIAYMDACIQRLFQQLESLGILDDTIVVINSDHGETLYDHDCWFDHHGIYDVTLKVPLIIRYPKKVPAGKRINGYNQHMDLLPTLLELTGIKTDIKFDGQSLMPMVRGKRSSHASSFYITECTWMRKHGWRTPEWKLIHALEPDFHFKPEVELYNLVEDPDENRNLARKHPDIVALLEKQMQDHIATRTRQTGLHNPMDHQEGWAGGHGNFTSSQEAYDTLHIGDAATARKLQAKTAEKKK
ncbi:MAG: sulfatase [Verrucomicrobia bacterium]|jgi:arylsulfatase A-like enzyme|nr:sulfatase [Verrucomicrobiota bacterium]MBT7067761.1 sulfatase [Verrucomicrobiota bacterium]MBT7702266.1 sulfatase [Verrucomicrobiota bacterium]